MPEQWSARAVPRHRRALADGLEADSRRFRDEARRQRFVEAARLEDEARGHHAAAWLVEGADLYWVTHDMAALAMDAAHDVPVFSVTDLPGPNGIVLFQRPLPPVLTPPVTLVDGSSWQGEVPVSGLWWHPWKPAQMRVSVLCRRADLPRPIHSGTGQLQSTSGMVLQRGQVMDLTEPTEGVAAQHLPILAFLSSMSVLMMTPTVAERRSLDARTGGEPRPQTRPSDLVSTIDLRPLRYVRTDEPGEGGRIYHHRWIVRGHWTHQPCGPGQSERKLIYRAPYIKGPQDAPLLATDKVMVWRR